MPLGTLALATTQVGATADNVTTASFAPAVGDLLIAFAASRTAAGVPPVITDSLGSTWSLIDEEEFGNINTSLYYHVAVSTTARTVTATSTSATQVGLAVLSVSGASTDFSNFQIGTNGAGDPSVTMAAFGASSMGVGFYAGNAGGSNVTTPTGYNAITNSQIATNIRFCVADDPSNPATSMSWSGPSTDSICYGLEIKEDAGGGSHDLTSLDISNAPSIGLSTIGQTNGLTALDIANAPSIGTAAISQAQGLNSQNLANAPVIQSSTLSQTHNLLASNLSNAPFITQAQIETGNPNYIKLRNAIRLMRRKSVRVIFRDEMWDDDNPEEL